MKNWILVFVLLGLLTLVGCNQDEQSKSEDIPVITDGYEVIATDLDIPWSIDFNGESFFITEREGYIVKITGTEVERQHIFLDQPLSDAAEAGLLGFLLHPHKGNSAIVYYTYENESGQFNRVVEMSLEEDGWHEVRVLLDQIPSGSVHHGGRIKIGPDEKLYVTAGDASNAELAQSLNSLGGKILRMNLDGTIPSDNPFGDSYVYSYGHRNPQGLAWDANGQLYSSEHGQSAHDEINLIKPGANYGWPVIQGDETMEGMEKPLFHSGETTWAPSGISYQDGVLYVAQLRGQGVLGFDLEAGTYEKIVSGFGRVRDVYILEDNLYFITNNTDGRGTPQPNDDKLVRISLTRQAE